MHAVVTSVLALAGLALAGLATTAHAAGRPLIEIHAMADCAAAGSMKLATGGCMARGALVRGGDFTGIGHVRFGRGQDVLVVTMSDAGRRHFYGYTQAQAGKPVAVVIDGRVVSMPVVSEPLQPASLEIPGLTGAQIDALVLRFRGPPR
jgi:preprotein translocase subunit SecD